MNVIIVDVGGSVFFAIAGIAVHLPGVVASETRLPVIGVPVAALMGGQDALLLSCKCLPEYR